MCSSTYKMYNDHICRYSLLCVAGDVEPLTRFIKKERYFSFKRFNGMISIKNSNVLKKIRRKSNKSFWFEPSLCFCCYCRSVFLSLDAERNKVKINNSTRESIQLKGHHNFYDKYLMMMEPVLQLVELYYNSFISQNYEHMDKRITLDFIWLTCD